MTLVTLVCGGDGTARENAIAAHALPGYRTTAIIEGIPTGASLLNDEATSNGLQIIRIAPGCPCCTGNLSMRVILNRALRDRPDRLYLSIANSEHLPNVINFLQDDQYQNRLEIGETLDCSMPGTGFAHTLR